MFGTLGSARASAKNKNDRSTATDADVNELQGNERIEAINDALNDDRSEAVYDALVDSKLLNPQSGQAQVHRTETSNGPWLTVVVPYAPAPGDEQIYLFWTTNENLSTQVSMSHLFPPSAYNGPWNVEEAYFDDGSISVREETVSVPQPETDGPTTQILGCSSPNWGCILSTAGAYVGTITACAVCYQSAGVVIPACGSCLSTILGSAGLTISCDYCG